MEMLRHQKTLTLLLGSWVKSVCITESISTTENRIQTKVSNLGLDAGFRSGRQTIKNPLLCPKNILAKMVTRPFILTTKVAAIHYDEHITFQIECKRVNAFI